MKDNTPLMKASINGDLETVKSILDKHPNEINKQNKHSSSALMLAILYNRHQIVKELLERGASREDLVF